MNSSFTSQAGNFISALQTGVDPRTGQYNINLPLAALHANNMLGPELSLTLSYSPLTTTDYGFGTGFSLGLTQFSNSSNLLELSSGEKYRVEAGSDTVQGQRLNNFVFRYTSGSNDSEGYTVAWKEGKTEYLTAAEDGTTFVTTRILSPLGREITLEWEWSGTAPLLSRISDESATLLSVTYGTFVVATVWPDSDDAYTIQFELDNDTWLSVIRRQMTDSETLTWNLGYDYAGESDSSYLVTEVAFPTGMTEVVSYNSAEGLSFPDDSGLSWLPVVSSHTRTPGGGQDETVTYYEYTSNNFLGYNGDFGNWDSARDYIYTTLTDYTYGSTETITCGDSTLVTTRTYNNYHLPLSELVSRNGCSRLTETEWYAGTGTYIDDQPAQFQLPKRQVVSWTDDNGNSRQEVTLTEFDDYGNPTSETSPDGTITTTTWYDANGEDGCPAEPNGLVRFMKQQTVTPPDTEYTTPVQKKHFTYERAGAGNYIVLSSERACSDDTLLSARAYRYDTTSGSGEFGRVIAQSDTLYDLTDGQAYSSSLSFLTTIGNGEMTQVSVFTGHDGLTASTERVQSVYSGNLLKETDTQGVVTLNTYDLAGRILTQTLASGSAYARTSTWAYTIEGTGPLSTETDAAGNAVRTHYDGAGRVVRVQHYDADNTAVWYDVQTTRYNAFGEQASSRGSDWLLTGSQSVEYTQVGNNTWGSWGEITQTTWTDGQSTLQSVDPVAMRHTASQTGEAGLSSGRIVTTHDLNNRPLTVTRLTFAGGEDGTRTCRWDGLGRLCRETDELGNTTLRSYDAYGRVISQTLPDGSVVSRGYAPHLTGSQVVSIAVTGPDADGNTTRWDMGSQTFDSLGRLTESTSGGRTTAYTYTGATPAPSEVTLPSGDVLTYTYIPELGNAVSIMTANDVTQTFSYDALTGQLLEAAEDGGARVSRAWHTSGNLKAEETSLRSDNARTASYTWTLGGMPGDETDVAGMTRHYTRDAYGRVTYLEDGALAATLTYDALGRLSQQSVIASGSDAALTAALTYDDFGREVRRTVTDSNGTVTGVMQSWYANGQLRTRATTQDNSTVRSEAFTYDNRNRLVSHTVSGTSLLPDAYGNTLSKQTFSYDALNNLTEITTTLSDGSVDTAIYAYQNNDDPTQLTSVAHTHDSYPALISLDYDTCGRMVLDEAGRTLSYDVYGRLTGVSADNLSAGTYGYDALNRLVAQNVSDSDSRELYYRGDERVCEVLASQDKVVRLIKAGRGCLAMDNDGALTLTAGDQHNSLLWSRDESEEDGTLHGWQAYGYGSAGDLLPGFNGERRDPVSGTYHLGNGYRAYNPVLMRFNCPDSLSPFGEGGINPYAYCAGDPINRTDPTGHLSGGAIAGITLGALGLLAAIFTAGASIAAAGGVMAAVSSASATSLVLGTAGVVSDVTAIASGAVEAANPEASSALGWVSLATGLAGFAVSVGGSTVKALSRGTADLRLRLGNIMETGLSGRGRIDGIAEPATVPRLTILSGRQLSSEDRLLLEKVGWAYPKDVDIATMSGQERFISRFINTESNVKSKMNKLLALAGIREEIGISKKAIMNAYEILEPFDNRTTLGWMRNPGDSRPFINITLNHERELVAYNVGSFKNSWVRTDGIYRPRWAYPGARKAYYNYLT